MVSLCCYLYLLFLTIVSISDASVYRKSRKYVRDSPYSKPSNDNIVKIVPRTIFISWPSNIGSTPSRMIVEQIQRTDNPEEISTHVANVSLEIDGTSSKAKAILRLRDRSLENSPFRFCLVGEDGVTLMEMETANSWGEYLRTNTCPRSNITYIAFNNESKIVATAQYQHPFAIDSLTDDN